MGARRAANSPEEAGPGTHPLPPVVSIAAEEKMRMWWLSQEFILGT